MIDVWCKSVAETDLTQRRRLVVDCFWQRLSPCDILPRLPSTAVWTIKSNSANRKPLQWKFGGDNLTAQKWKQNSHFIFVSLNVKLLHTLSKLVRNTCVAWWLFCTVSHQQPKFESFHTQMSGFNFTATYHCLALGVKNIWWTWSVGFGLTFLLWFCMLMWFIYVFLFG